MGLSYDEGLKLPPRLQNALEEHGIFTWSDLLHRSIVDLRTVTRIPREKKPDGWRSDRMFGGGDADFFER